jgi:hypothetical protein
MVKGFWRISWILLIAISLSFLGLILFAAHRIDKAQSARRDQFNADGAAMLLPQNYKPAGIYMARLMQSDPKLWDSDPGSWLPDWLPAELGSVHLNEISVAPGTCWLQWGGGGDDILGNEGYSVSLDSNASTDSRAAYVLEYGGSRGAGTYKFTIAKSDHIDEEEFVRRGLAEIDREQAAFAAGTEVNVYNNDPAYMRKQLLSQHPTIAAKLGFTIPAPPASPSSAQTSPP